VKVDGAFEGVRASEPAQRECIPNTFAHDAEAEVVEVDPAGDLVDAIRNAVEACPTSALQLIEEGE